MHAHNFKPDLEMKNKVMHNLTKTKQTISQSMHLVLFFVTFFSPSHIDPNSKGVI